ncbi:tyrosine-type recombinase/integrase [uncultured Clostridium sp.]|uniref:tyrosine-type recombinase/integrase n=1 Tax=uncultured Clostridium sp. TaxID=59620 RepID=UPI002630068A|nr:tyrosine-type recombinase/integrase [uncultured Clostridium sp.]
METNDKTSRGINKAQEVEPLKRIKDIAKIKQFLLGKENKRDYMLLVVGINVGLRAGDLLSLSIKNVFQDNKIVDKVVITEEKTDKKRVFELNKSAKDAILLYLSTLKNIDTDSYLFKSRKGDGALTVEAAHKIIKTTLKELNIKGNFGTHTLRKTFAYHIYANNIKTNPSIVNTLQKILNHSSESITLKYIGITKEVISNVYNSLNL